jgi:hypothetical protein
LHLLATCHCIKVDNKDEIIGERDTYRGSGACIERERERGRGSKREGEGERDTYRDIGTCIERERRGLEERREKETTKGRECVGVCVCACGVRVW